jgi:hypothetical protein
MRRKLNRRDHKKENIKEQEEEDKEKKPEYLNQFNLQGCQNWRKPFAGGPDMSSRSLDRFDRLF